ncbi:exo-beta-N-acetylmuramidase NamZ family protein [Chondromyces crocatus]|uniref:DUF1343 domain-containing protein n=1 Tax=Chondromyces crocatus TaxID=52 RepID=A0A0K1E5I7_CHOCO|nr:DUF1343 domain-containing protein [Chondromyces crocatus]AKT36135.1 uncharacterized protein CMC5_002480 [Chondromyces crocatus]
MHVGIDRLPDLSAFQQLRTARVGVLAHPASVNRNLTHIADVLAAHGVRPRIFFGPEHGYGGEAQDMDAVSGSVDPRTGARVISLYGERFEDLTPKAADLAEIDVLIMDLADVGCRHYTFVWTSLMVLRAAHQAGVRVVLLDRPNPIGGALESVEGALQEPGFLSFVGLEAVPIRHALTVGEIVALFARREGLSVAHIDASGTRVGSPDAALTVVPPLGWAREQTATAWDRPFVMTSPNMPTVETALVYPGGCLIEGTNLSEGRGTTRPFELVGAPWVDGRKLAEDLLATGLAGFLPRPLTFCPTTRKHAGKICGGVQIHVTDTVAFRPVATYVALIGLARRQNPELFEFRTERYEYVDDIPAIDLLLGSAKARKALEAGEDPAEVATEAARVDPAWAGVMREALVAAGSTRD